MGWQSMILKYLLAVNTDKIITTCTGLTDGGFDLCVLQ